MKGSDPFFLSVQSMVEEAALATRNGRLMVDIP